MSREKVAKDFGLPVAPLPMTVGAAAENRDDEK